MEKVPELLQFWMQLVSIVMRLSSFMRFNRLWGAAELKNFSLSCWLETFSLLPPLALPVRLKVWVIVVMGLKFVKAHFVYLLANSLWCWVTWGQDFVGRPFQSPRHKISFLTAQHFHNAKCICICWESFAALCFLLLFFFFFAQFF